MTNEAAATNRSLGGWWAVPALRDDVGPRLTDAAITGAQASLGVTLPSLYLALLRQQNGGTLRAGGHLTSTLWGIGRGRYNSITGSDASWPVRGRALLQHEDDDDDERDDHGHWRPAQQHLLIPFSGDGHAYLCFDYRARGPHEEPAITCVDLELEGEHPGAASFGEYLALIPDPAPRPGLRVRGGPGAGAIAEALAAHFRFVARRHSAFDFGYPTWTVRLPSALPLPREQRFVSITPNRVPATFRREGKRVLTSKRTALLHPEAPWCTAILMVEAAGRDTVVAALRALELDFDAP